MQFTDAEQRFADSPDGLRIVAKERRQFDLVNAHMGDRAPTWTDAHTASVVRQACCATARTAVTDTARNANAQRQEPVIRAARDTARAMGKAQLSNAWRGD